MRWLGRIGALLLLVFGVFLLREVRSSTSPSVVTGATDKSPANDETVATHSPDTTRPSRNGPAVPQGPGAILKVPPNPFAPAVPRNTGGGGGGEAPIDAGVATTDADDPIWAKQNGEEPSAYRVRVRIGLQRLERGNYKGALEYVTLIINEQPTFTDAYKVAIPALCALGDLTTARDYLGRFTQETDRNEVIESCSNLGAKLTP